MSIEELAFKNYYELINIQKIDLLLIIEFLQKDRKQWINQFTQTHNENVEIQKENEQLKANYERLYNENCKLREEHNINDISLLDENQKLKDNWNKLKEWVNKDYDYYINNENEDYIGGRLCFTDMKNKMQELEQRSDSNDNY